jgi:tripartite-type tricarboxylate transporter receptor subunit TctC
MIQRFVRIAACLAAISSLAWAGSAAQAQQFRPKLITLVVGYSAGGQADALARTVAKRLSEFLAVTVVVENRPGANGLIASQSVARSAPDGSTLLLVTDAMATIDPQLPGPGKFDLSASLAPVVNMASAPLFLAAHKDVPANSIAAVVELGRQKPDSLSFGTSGSATPHRLSGEMLQKLGGFRMLHVPYKGTAASVTDLLGGQIPLVFGAATALEPLAKAGKIKLLGVTSEKRFPLLPDVPAISETFPGFNVVTYMGLMVPKATSAAVIATLNTEVNRVLSSPDTREWLEKQGMVAVGGSPAEFTAQIQADYEARGKIIREVGLTAD